jgi:hypothetical protein
MLSIFTRLRATYPRLLWLLWLALAPPAGHAVAAGSADAAPRLEYQVKAGYLYNFLRFTEWPADSLPAGAPYRIGVIDDEGTTKIIADSLNEKRINERPIQVVALPSDGSTMGCHLIFVPRTRKFTITQTPPPPVLLVGESDSFAAESGMIGFVTRGYNIRFQVNLVATQRAGLKLSGRLASLAEIVQPGFP